MADQLLNSTSLKQQSPVLSVVDIPEYSLHALKVFHGWMCHELTNQDNRIVEVRSGDDQVYMVSDYLSEPFWVPCRSRVEAKLHIPIQRS